MSGTLAGDSAVSPLSESTRKERRALLMVAVLLAAVSFGGIKPSRVEQLGLSFDATQLTFLTTLLTIVEFYFIVTFFVYGRAERTAWRRAAYDFEQEIVGGLAEGTTQLERSLGKAPVALIQKILRDIASDLRLAKPFVELSAYNKLTDVLDEIDESTEGPDSDSAERFSIGDFARTSRTSKLLRSSPGSDVDTAVQAICALSNLATDLESLFQRITFGVSRLPRNRRRVYHRRHASQCERALLFLRSGGPNPLFQEVGLAVSRIAALQSAVQAVCVFAKAFPELFSPVEHEKIADVLSELKAVVRWREMQPTTIDESRDVFLDEATSTAWFNITSAANAVSDLKRLREKLLARLRDMRVRAWFEFDLPIYLGLVTTLVCIGHMLA